VSSEKTVRLGDRTVTITGDDGDGFVADLPPEIREPALDCANVVLTDTSVVLDIGANLGLLTIGFADLVPGGRVVAIEPAPRTFQRLSENVAGAELKNVDLLNLALSDSAGTLEFFESDWFSAGSFVKERTLAAGIHTGAITVEARTVDELVDDLELRHVDFMKIDVEGHELKVLRGAKRTIAEMRPIAVIELNLFTTTSFGNVLPIDFVTEIRDIFPYVYDYRIGEGVFAISDDNAVYSRVQQQFLTGRPSDLICSFEPLTELAVARLVDLANAEALGGDLHGGGRDARSRKPKLGSSRASGSWRSRTPQSPTYAIARRRWPRARRQQKPRARPLWRPRTPRSRVCTARHRGRRLLPYDG